MLYSQCRLQIQFVVWKKSQRFNILERRRFSSRTIYTYIEHVPLNPFFFHSIKVIVFAKNQNPLIIVN